MSKSFIVARWEFLEKIKTKSFILSLIITPAIMITFSLLPALLANREADTTKAVGIIDSSGKFFTQFQETLEQYKIDEFQPAYILVNLYDKDFSGKDLIHKSDSLIIHSRIEGVLFISDSSGTYNLQYRSMNTGNLKDIQRFERAFNEVRIKISLSSAGIDKKLMNSITTDSEIRQVRLDKYGRETESGFLEIFFSSLLFIMILVFVILSSGGMLIRSLVEEKSNRLIEILVSSCTPGELLTGKILGLSALALLQIIIWGMIGLTLAGNNVIPISAFNNIFPMLVYFLLGFIFYISLFVGMGSVLSTEQEAQQVTGYLSIILLLPVVFSISTIENPDSSLVKILSYIPLTTPTIMLLKLNIKPVPLPEMFLTIAVMLISIYIVVYFSSKVFRIGILSYGKVPSLKQIIHWIKED